MLSGLYGLLFGAGRSVFLNAPSAIAALFLMRELMRRPGMLTSAFLLLPALVLLLLVDAVWWAWCGDWGWGPRLLGPLLTAFFLPLIGSSPIVKDIPRRGVRLAACAVLASSACAGLLILVALAAVSLLLALGFVRALRPRVAST